MRVVRIAENEVVVIHPHDGKTTGAFCAGCSSRAVVVADYSAPMVEPWRKYFCQEHYDRAELEEWELWPSKD